MSDFGVRQIRRGSLSLKPGDGGKKEENGKKPGSGIS
jgi:hypothetical protein